PPVVYPPLCAAEPARCPPEASGVTAPAAARSAPVTAPRSRHGVRGPEELHCTDLAAPPPGGPPAGDGLYGWLLPESDLAAIASAVPAGARLLQLGPEDPLLTESLVESGFAVTFAENASPEDPEQGPGAARRPIEDLDLGERFDAVLLCSFLVHSAEPGAALRMLGACLRHTADGGSVLVQREPYGAHTLLGRRHPSPDGGCRGGRPGSSHAAHRGPDARRLRVSQRAPGVVPLPAAD